MTSHRASSSATSNASGSDGVDGPGRDNGRAGAGSTASGGSRTDASSASGASASGGSAGNTPGGSPGGSRVSGQTLYQLLELTPAASAAELRQAFRSLSKRYHPDTTSLPAAEAREAFARLRQAYGVLADPDSRRAYDASLRRPAPQPSLVVPAPPFPTGPAAAPQPIGVRRSLSGGEWFALVLLGLALALSLVLGVGLAWARGTALITRPSWLIEPLPGAAQLPVVSNPRAAVPPATPATAGGSMPSTADVAVDPAARALHAAGIRQAP